LVSTVWKLKEFGDSRAAAFSTVPFFAFSGLNGVLVFGNRCWRNNYQPTIYQYSK
jgi:hypothetical protein